MLGGGGRYYDFPHGIPAALVAMPFLFFVSELAWVILGEGLQGWARFLPVLAIFGAYAVISIRLLSHYERTGRAVKIRRQRLVVRFDQGWPAPMLAARLAFLLAALATGWLFVAAVVHSRAGPGILVCVFALIALLYLNVALERHYVNSGRARQVDLRAPGEDQRNAKDEQGTSSKK